MKALLCVVIFAVLVSCAVSLKPLAEEEYEYLFNKWTQQHSKKYSSPQETVHRYNIFKANMVHIRTQNAAKKSFTLAMNQFGDLTNAEFRAQYNGFVPLDNEFLRSQNYANLFDVVTPDTKDWVDEGKVTDVKDQGQCGSCWAFSSTGSLEAAYAISNNVTKDKLISLSEQQLVDCSTAQGNQGCNGGLMDQAFQYVISNKGLGSEASYPYKAVDGTCQQVPSEICITGYTDVTPNNEDALKTAVAQQPVSVAVDASGLDWQFYSSGVMSDACGTQLDHGVLAVGYGTLNGQTYWKVKNSWGKGWGMQGYVLLKRGSGSGSPGECGITLAASYPTGAAHC